MSKEIDGVRLVCKGIKTIVTSLKFTSNTLLAGVGGFLFVFQQCNAKWQLSLRMQIFHSQNIYGIRPKERDILIFGGKKYSIVRAENGFKEFQKTASGECSDWILDACWLPTSSEQAEICLITAHGKVLKINCHSEEIISSLTCPDRCILYSGKILLHRWDNMILFSGTVRNQLNIWSNGEGDCGQILHQLVGHKGVIFSVNYDEASSRISTTSDDRSVRIWQVQFSSDSSSGTSLLSKWKSAVISLNVTVYGHTARVWDCHFLNDGRFISIGEDSVVCVWEASGSLANCMSGHGGGGMRSISSDGDLLATGGCDGSISLWPLTAPILSLLPVPPSDRKSTPKHLCLSSDGDVILFCEGGNILTYNKDWKSTFRDEHLSSYCVMSLSDDRKLLALGSINGHLTILQYIGGIMNEVYSGNILTGRLFSIHWMDNFLLLCGSEGVLKLIRLNFCEQGYCEIFEEKSFSLPISKERWTTCCAMAQDKFVICGDRCGALHLYALDQDDENPVQTIRKAHSSKGVSHLISAGEFIMSCGKDGTVKKYTLNDEALEVVFCENLKIDWAASLIATKKFGVLLTGFHDVNFVVWSLFEDRFLMKIKCGGGHRSWDLLFNETSDLVSLAFIKNKHIYYLKETLSTTTYSSPLLGSHSRAVNAGVNILLGGRQLIISGGEDTNLRLSSSCLDPLIVLRGHLSSVRALTVAEHSDQLYLFSAGGRAQLKAWRLSLHSDGEVLFYEVGHWMLRPEDFMRRNWREATPLPDAETRIMALCSFCEEDTVTVASAASDGNLRIFNLAVPNENLQLQNTYFHNEKCMLKICSFVVGEVRFLCTTSTDGKYTFWNLKSGMSKQEFSVHPAGINSIDTCVEEYLVVVVTGGDDSSLCISLFDFTDTSQIILVQTIIMNHIHTCQVTGIKVVGNLIISGGLDQRINLLQWALKDKHLEVRLLHQCLSSIPDIHDLSAWTENEDLHVCLFGIGLEMLHGDNILKGR